jgi:hypothetical protein
MSENVRARPPGARRLCKLIRSSVQAIKRVSLGAAECGPRLRLQACVAAPMQPRSACRPLTASVSSNGSTYRRKVAMLLRAFSSLLQLCEQEEGLVRKLTMTLTAAVLVLGTMAMQANAQNQQRGAATIHALKNATPIVTPAACYGGTGYCGCGPGWISACSPRCCRCVPCW